MTARLTQTWDRILERVTLLTDECWQWGGSVNSKGYGEISTGTRLVLVHRVAHEAVNGPIPAGLVVDHTCHRPASCPGGRECLHRRCVNPAHLEAVTVAENSRRGAQQNRARCKRGHLLGVRMRGAKPVRCCRRCESIDRRDRRVAAREQVSA